MVITSALNRNPSCSRECGDLGSALIVVLLVLVGAGSDLFVSFN